jgi:hypothetical protein
MLNDNPAQVVLYGNLAADDSSVETAGIAESMFAVEELRYTSRVPTKPPRVLRRLVGFNHAAFKHFC